MRSLRKLCLVAVMGGLALLCATSPAQAQSPFMRLLSSGGGDTGVIVGTGGAVGFAGVLPGDSTLFINSTTGVSKPILGSATDPTMDLNSINVRISPETKTDVLTILLSDTNFGPSGRGKRLCFCCRISERPECDHRS